MDKNEVLQKMMGLGSEAQDKSPLDMWRHRAGKPFIKRFGAAAIGLSMSNSHLRGQVLNRLTAQLPGPRREIIGHGHNQIVMDEDDLVLKVMVRTVQDSSEGARRIAQSIQSDSDICAAYLGTSWLQTEFDTLGLRNGRTVVVARQPRLGAFAHLYPSASDVPRGPERQARLEAIHRLADDYGLYPDLVGRANIARTLDNPILFIDTEPLRSASLDADAPTPELSLRHRMNQALLAWQD